MSYRLMIAACVFSLAGCTFEGELSEDSGTGGDLHLSQDLKGERSLQDQGSTPGREGGTIADGPHADQTATGDAVPEHDTGTTQHCSNGIREGSEACDGDDFGQKDCASEGYDLGDLVCRDDCTIDDSGCFSCGSSSEVCGDACCDQPDACIAGSCCAAAKVCGGQCCGGTETCLNDSCCPTDHLCGSACCTGSQLCYDGINCAAPSSGQIALYVTTSTYNGALGGRSGADAICASDRPAELTCSKLHAFLSISSADAIAAMPTTFGYNQIKPLYFYNRSLRQLSLFAGKWNDAMDGSILISAKNGTGATFGTWNDFWTGSQSDGAYDEVYGTYPYDYGCGGFTTSSDHTSGGIPTYGAVGDAGETNAYWLHSSNNYPQCHNDSVFLCACQL